MDEAHGGRSAPPADARLVGLGAPNALCKCGHGCLTVQTALRPVPHQLRDDPERAIDVAADLKHMALGMTSECWQPPVHCSLAPAACMP